jgi:MraZ protein
MFSGEYEYKIDAKGRVSIPPKFRSQFADGIVLNKGVDGCIDAYTLSAWNEATAQFQSLPIVRSEKSRRMSRILFSSAFNLELDEQGRIMLPPALRQHAAIKDTLVITGVSNYLEIWSKEAWDKEQALMRKEAWQIFESAENRK